MTITGEFAFYAGAVAAVILSAVFGYFTAFVMYGAMP